MSANTGKFVDMVKDTASAVSGATVTLNNTPTAPFQAFGNAQAYANGDVVPVYKISDASNWEDSYGVYTSAGTTLARAATPLASSNAGAQVASFSGTITVAVVDPAAYANNEIWGLDSSRWYTNFHSATVTTTGTWPTGTVVYIPVLINQWFSSVTLSANISAVFAGVATYDIGLYTNLNGRANTRLCQTTGINVGTGQGTNGATNNSGSITPSQPCPPGIYWIGLVTTTNTPTFNIWANAANAVGINSKELLGITTVAIADFNAISMGWTEVSATLPATASASPSLRNTSAVILAAKVAL